MQDKEALITPLSLRRKEKRFYLAQEDVRKLETCPWGGGRHKKETEQPVLKGRKECSRKELQTWLNERLGKGSRMA